MEKEIRFLSGKYEIEGCLEKSSLQKGAVITHPHPLYGGDMHNNVVAAITRVYQQAGYSTLRFNFRGVGKTEASHDQGRGELDDVAFLLAALREQWPQLPVILCGFSFGAYMALSVAAADDQVRALITIAPPLAYAGNAEVPQPQCDWLLIHGTADDVVGYEETQQRAQAMRQPPQWVTLDGAGHFFHGQLGDLRAQVEPWLAARLN